MNETSDLLLVDLLINEKYFTREDFEKIAISRPTNETSLRNYLIKQNLVTEENILFVLNKESGYPIANTDLIQGEKSLLKLISLVQATTYKIFPLRKENDELIIGMVDIYDPNIFDDLRFSFNFSFKVELISETTHKSLIKNFYQNETAASNTQIKDDNILTSKINDFEGADPSINEAPVVVLLNNILHQAIVDHASDIHFEPFENEFKIRYRIDGTLYDMIPPPRNLAMSVLSRIKVMAKMNIAEKRVPQDGRISLSINKKNIDLRVSTIPAAFGESAVIRVLDRSHIELDLDKLGLNRSISEQIRKVIKKPNGIFISTGPTGAGKTTTMYSCLREINTIDSKIITTEDPVEYDIEGTTQVAINENIGLDFAACLRSILRQDPDKIMVGEIRDSKTMNMAIQASLTGHLVLTTLHTNDSASAITRLIDMGVEPFLLCSALEAILAQRLIRTICSNCKEEYTPNKKILEILKFPFEKDIKYTFYKGRGCDKCNGIGYKGRTGIYEMLVITDPIRKLIMEGATANKIKSAAKDMGMKLLLEDGLQKIHAGVTTPEEVAMWITEH